MKKYLTYQELKKLEACEDALMSFRSIFGKGASIEQVVYRLRNPGKRDKYTEEYEEWLGWLMAQTQELTIALLKAEANVHASNDYALYWAAGMGYTGIVKILLKAGAGVHADNDRALCWAAENGHTETVKILLKKGADVHVDDDYTLRWAARYGHTEMVRILKAEMKKKKK